MSTVYAKAQTFLNEHQVDPVQGLTHQQVESQRQQFSSNEVDLPPPEPWWKNLLEKFAETLIVARMALPHLLGGDVSAVPAYHPPRNSFSQSKAICCETTFLPFNSAGGSF